MVMEMPSPQCVGQEFVRQYYTLLHQAPEHMHRFYSHDSSFVHGGIEKPGEELPPVMGQAAIHKKIMSLNFRDCHAKIRQVDSQSTIDKAVVVQVAGELSNAGQPMRRFMQTFVLAPQSPKKYYVHNDIFRYQDEVFHDVATDSEPDAAELDTADEYEGDATGKQADVNCEQQLDNVEQVSNGSACRTASVEPEVKLTARDPGIVREAEVTVTVGESVNVQKTSVEGETPLVSVSVSEAVHQSSTPTVQNAGTVTAQSVPSVSPSSSADTKVLEPPKQVSWAALASKNMSSAVVQGSVASQPKPQATVKPEVKPETTPASAPLPQRVPRSEQRISVDRDSGLVVGTAAGDGEETIRRPRYADNVQIFVGNLPHLFTDHELRDYFEKFGVVVDVRVNRRGPSRDLPNFGFVVFENPETVQKVLEQKPLFIMDGKYRLNVEEKRQQGVGGPVRGSPRGSYRGYPSSRGSSGRGGWRGRGRGMRSYGPGRSSDDDNSGDEPLAH